MDYLTPIMEVIRSHETSGPVTGVALTAVSRFLDAYIIGVVAVQRHPNLQSYKQHCLQSPLAAYLRKATLSMARLTS